MLGASERPSVGRTIVENLERIGFKGEIYPINPRYETLLGRRCYRSVEELPAGVDVLAFCVNHERVPDGLRPAARKGVRAAVAFDAGFAESDDAGRRRQDELVSICREAGIAFCGPNCMGVISLHRCLEALGDYAWADRAGVAEIDVNPIVVLPRGQGCVVVDALIVPWGA